MDAQKRAFNQEYLYFGVICTRNGHPEGCPARGKLPSLRGFWSPAPQGVWETTGNTQNSVIPKESLLVLFGLLSLGVFLGGSCSFFFGDEQH